MATFVKIWRGPQVQKLITRKVREAVRDVAIEYLELCREECPVDTGWLRHSQVMGYYSTVVGFWVGAMADYASFVHKGTSRQRANPWMDRAIARLNAASRGIFVRSFR